MADDADAARVLLGLWAYREHLGSDHPTVPSLSDAGNKLKALIVRLEGGRPPPTPSPKIAAAEITESLRQRILHLSTLDPQARGFAFEKFLKDAFGAFGLQAHGAFRNTGEQIDGSFQVGAVTYLLEAKWQNGLTGAADLHVFQGKLDQKVVWARGLFISVSGFSIDGLQAFGRGKKVNCMDGRDFSLSLNAGSPCQKLSRARIARPLRRERRSSPSTTYSNAGFGARGFKLNWESSVRRYNNDPVMKQLRSLTEHA